MFGLSVLSVARGGVSDYFGVDYRDFCRGDDSCLPEEA